MNGYTGVHPHPTPAAVEEIRRRFGIPIISCYGDTRTTPPTALQTGARAVMAPCGADGRLQ